MKVFYFFLKIIKKSIKSFQKPIDKPKKMLYNVMAFAGVAESADAHV